MRCFWQPLRATIHHGGRNESHAREELPVIILEEDEGNTTLLATILQEKVTAGPGFVRVGQASLKPLTR